MKRVLDIIAYSVTGLVLAGGVAYGWRELTRPPPIPPVPPLAEPAVLPPAPTPAPTPAPPAQRVEARGWPPPRPVAAQPQPDPDFSAAQALAEDQERYDSLRRACYQAAANNRNGDYPGFQAMACGRYEQFAAERGWDPGEMPPYGEPPQPRPEPMVAEQPVYQDEPQVIVLGPDYYGNNHHHRRPEQPATPLSRPQQIGPNFTPPSPQQPPPVSQRQSGRVARAAAQN